MIKRETYASSLDLVNSERESYLKELKEKYALEKILKNLDLLKNLKILVIGDTVIDQYTYVFPKGRAIKDPIISTKFESEDNYAGGVLALANHISSYVDKVKLVTLIGDQNSMTEFIGKSLSQNIELRLFTKKNSPTTIKKRYVDSNRGHKLFKVEYMNDLPISKELSEEIEKFLSEELPKYDVVIVTDYGHGFINKDIREILQEKSKFLSLNVQINSSNMGYNYVSQYNSADFITMNDEEIRLPLRMKFEEIGEVISKFHERFKHKKFLVTLGKNGCLFFNEGEQYSAPALINKTIDTVGAGDSVFAITSIFVYSGIENEIIPFIANCAGGIGANIIGNKEFVTKDKLLDFIREIYDGLA